MAKPKPSRNKSKGRSYNPKGTLASYLEERLQLEKLREKKPQLSEQEHKRLRTSDRMKVHILDTIVFPSMANLVYFFEKIAAEPILAELFEDELRDMLDRSEKVPLHIDQIFAGTGVGVSIRDTMFTRLIASALVLNQWLPDEKFSENFRMKLIHDLQSIVYVKMAEILEKEQGYLGLFNPLTHRILQDVLSALNWVLYTGKTTGYSNEKPRRMLEFDPPKNIFVNVPALR